jgi:hypothetical protein
MHSSLSRAVASWPICLVLAACVDFPWHSRWFAKPLSLSSTPTSEGHCIHYPQIQHIKYETSTMFNRCSSASPQAT